MFVMSPLSFSQQHPKSEPDAKKQHYSYDLVSIHLNRTESDVTSSWQKTTDGFRVTNEPLFALIWSAYQVKNPDMISGLPKWSKSSFYDLEAKMDQESLESWNRLPAADKAAAEQQMLQNILIDRFHLQCHTEQKEVPVYLLVVDPGGFKLKPKVQPRLARSETGAGVLEAHSFQIYDLATALSNDAGRLIEDRTGIKGYYDFTLKWSPDDTQLANDSRPSLFKALQEQLGLKLVPAKVKESVLVIDNLEKPTDN
jgi:uncharacterized protein (TIGR03435 family)